MLARHYPLIVLNEPKRFQRVMRAQIAFGSEDPRATLGGQRYVARWLTAFLRCNCWSVNQNGLHETRAISRLLLQVQSTISTREAMSHTVR